MFTIGIPGFFLAFEPNKNMIKGHFLTNVVLKALPAALTDALAVAATGSLWADIWTGRDRHFHSSNDAPCHCRIYDSHSTGCVAV